jgi:hypothetical protein
MTKGGHSSTLATHSNTLATRTSLRDDIRNDKGRATSKIRLPEILKKVSALVHVLRQVTIESHLENVSHFENVSLWRLCPTGGRREFSKVTALVILY